MDFSDTAPADCVQKLSSTIRPRAARNSSRRLSRHSCEQGKPATPTLPDWRKRCSHDRERERERERGERKSDLAVKGENDGRKQRRRGGEGERAGDGTKINAVKRSD